VIALSSSWVICRGEVDEVTWTPEQLVLTRLKFSYQDNELFVAAVHALRAAARQGHILSRRHPEHGFWEYGPSWRDKDFVTKLDLPRPKVHI